MFISMYHDGAGTKFTNTFYSPMLGLDNIDVNDNFEFHVTIGSQRFPDFSVDSTQESFMRLRNAKLMLTGNDSISITPAGYKNNKFITALSFEKAASATSHSGINTRSGSQLTLHLRNTNLATTVHVILLYDAVCDIGLSGTVVLDENSGLSKNVSDGRSLCYRSSSWNGRRRFRRLDE